MNRLLKSPFHGNSHPNSSAMTSKKGNSYIRPIDFRQANWFLRQDWRLFSTVPETRARLRRNERNNSRDSIFSAASTRFPWERIFIFTFRPSKAIGSNFVQARPSLRFKQAIRSASKRNQNPNSENGVNNSFCGWVGITPPLQFYCKYKPTAITLL